MKNSKNSQEIIEIIKSSDKKKTSSSKSPEKVKVAKNKKVKDVSRKVKPAQDGQRKKMGKKNDAC